MYISNNCDLHMRALQAVAGIRTCTVRTSVTWSCMQVGTMSLALVSQMFVLALVSQMFVLALVSQMFVLALVSQMFVLALVSQMFVLV